MKTLGRMGNQEPQGPDWKPVLQGLACGTALTFTNDAARLLYLLLRWWVVKNVSMSQLVQLERVTNISVVGVQQKCGPVCVVAEYGRCFCVQASNVLLSVLWFYDNLKSTKAMVSKISPGESPNPWLGTLTLWYIHCLPCQPASHIHPTCQLSHFLLRHLLSSLCQAVPAEL